MGSIFQKMLIHDDILRARLQYIHIPYVCVMCTVHAYRSVRERVTRTYTRDASAHLFMNCTRRYSSILDSAYNEHISLHLRTVYKPKCIATIQYIECTWTALYSCVQSKCARIWRDMLLEQWGDLWEWVEQRARSVRLARLEYAYAGGYDASKLRKRLSKTRDKRKSLTGTQADALLNSTRVNERIEIGSVEWR